MVSLPVVRGPGTYENLKIYYAAQGVSSKPGDDFYPDEGWVVVGEGATETSINISLVHDGRIKPVSQFIVRIVEVFNPLARLGPNIECLVTTEKSDYSHGKFQLVEPKVMTLPNLEIMTSVTIAIERTVSFLSEQKVFWRIFDFKTGEPLNDTMDVALAGDDNDESSLISSLSSSLTWKDGEGGKKSFSLLVKPHTSWEIEEKFVLRIVGVESNRPGQSASVDPLNLEITLIIEKFGFLNGLLRFETPSNKYFEEPPFGNTVIQFIILRTLGTYGDIQVSWMISGSTDPSKDFGETSGLINMQAGQSIAYVEVTLQHDDDDDEYDEMFTLVMSKTTGGADIDGNFSSLSFIIRGHGYPCGMFALDPKLQKFVTSSNPVERKIVLNISRLRGLDNTIMARLSLTYDQAENNLLYTNSKEFGVVVTNQTSGKVIDIEVNLNVFISSGSQFSACITSVMAIDYNVSIQPIIDPDRKCSQIIVPDEAGNSEIGFKELSVIIDYATQTSKIIIKRYGCFGEVQVDWSAKKDNSSFHSFILSEAISPSAGSIFMTHGQSLAYFDVKLTPDPNRKEMFMVTIDKFTSPLPVRLQPRTNLTCLIQPDGVVSINDKQLHMSIQQQNNEETMVSINLKRSYGSLTDMEVWYSAYSHLDGSDFKDIQYGKVLFVAGQITADLTIKMIPYLFNGESFFVNLTLARRLIANVIEGSYPLLAPDKSTSQISVKNDLSFGMFVMKQLNVRLDGWIVSENVSFLVSRTGDASCSAAVNVRSVGGGEPRDSTFGIFQTADNDTIAALMSKRNVDKRAYVGTDYKILDEFLDFNEGEKERIVNLTGLNFNDQQVADKEIFVYLRTLTSGLKVARPSRDSGLAGYSVVQIHFDRRWKEVIGFVVDTSMHLIGDEDSGILEIMMSIDRMNGSQYPQRNIHWQALGGTTSPKDVLEWTSGSFICGAGELICLSPLLLKDDNISRNTTWILIELSLVSRDDILTATIDENRKSCNLTLQENDFPNGKVGFTLDSTDVFVSQSDREFQLSLERTGYLNKAVSVTYIIDSLSLPSIVAGVEVRPAIDGIHYNKLAESVTLASGVGFKKLTLPLLSANVQKLESPFRFCVRLVAASSGCIIGEALSNVTITNEYEYPVWGLWSQVRLAVSNETLVGAMIDLNNLLKLTNFSKTMTTVTSHTIKYFSSAFIGSGLSKDVQTSTLDVLCSAIEINRLDAFLGFLPLIETVGLFANSLLPSSGSCDGELKSSTFSSCPLVTFVIKHCKAKDIESLTWKQLEGLESLTISLKTLIDFSSSDRCFKIVLVVYKSLLWFRKRDIGLKYIDNKILYINTFSIERQEPIKLLKNILYSFNTAMLPSQLSRCVFCDLVSDQCPADNSNNVCHLENNLMLGISHRIDCSCSVSSGAFGVVKEADNLLYPIWFHLSCLFVVITCTVSLLVHFFIQNETIIKLTMQMIFALLMYQLLYVMDVFLSPNILLSSVAYPCIIVSITVHFFYILQFVLIIVQVYNLQKVLHFNKDPNSISFLKNVIIAWGSSAFLIGAFCLCSYLIYNFALDESIQKFYGDVTGNKDVCFITSLYAGLIGYFFIQLLTFLTVVTFLQRTSTTWTQWENYDDIYKDNVNSIEYIFLVALFMIMIANHFFGGLHLIIRHQLILIIFVITNVSMGVYIITVYGLLRCFKCLQRKMRKESKNCRSSKFIRIKNNRNKNLNDVELVPNLTNFSDDSQISNFVCADFEDNKAFTDGIEDSNIKIYPHMECLTPVSSLKKSSVAKMTPKIRLQRSLSDNSIKPTFLYDDEDENTSYFLETSYASNEIDFLDDQKINDLIFVVGKSCSDIKSTNSLENINIRRHRNKNIMSDIFV